MFWYFYYFMILPKATGFWSISRENETFLFSALQFRRNRFDSVLDGVVAGW